MLLLYGSLSATPKPSASSVSSLKLFLKIPRESLEKGYNTRCLNELKSGFWGFFGLFFLTFFFKLEDNCFCNVVLGSAIQQCESALSVYPLLLEPLSHTPHPILHIGPRLSSLCYIAVSCICFTHSSVYMSVLLSMHPTLSFPHCVHKSVSLFLPCK